MLLQPPFPPGRRQHVCCMWAPGQGPRAGCAVTYRAWAPGRGARHACRTRAAAVVGHHQRTDQQTSASVLVCAGRSSVCAHTGSRGARRAVCWRALGTDVIVPVWGRASAVTACACRALAHVLLSCAGAYFVACCALAHVLSHAVPVHVVRWCVKRTPAHLCTGARCTSTQCTPMCVLCHNVPRWCIGFLEWEEPAFVGVVSAVSMFAV